MNCKLRRSEFAATSLHQPMWGAKAFKILVYKSQKKEIEEERTWISISSRLEADELGVW